MGPTVTDHDAGRSEARGSGSGLSERAVKSFVWAAISFGGNRLIVFASTLALTWILVPQQFGVVAAALTVVIFFEVGLDLGLGATVIYEQEEGHTERTQTAFTGNVLIAAALTLFVAAIAPMTAAFFNVPEETALFRVLALYLLIRGCAQIPDAMLRRDLGFKKRTVVEVTRAVVRACVTIGLALAGFGAWSIVGGLLIGQVFGVALSWVVVRFRPTFAFDSRIAREMLAFGLPVLGMRLVAALINNGDYLVVGNRLGDTELGIYQIAYRVPELVIGGVYLICSHIAFPTYSKARAEGAHMLRGRMLKALRLLTLFGFTAGAGLALAARDTINLLVAPEFAAAIAPMTLLSIGAGVMAVNFASGDIFPATGRPGTLLRLNLVQLVILAAALLLVVPHGIVWVAATLLPVHFLYLVVLLVLANRLVGSNVRENLTAMRPGFCAVLGLLAFALPVRLLTDTGLLPLLAIAIAAVVGAVVGMRLGSPSSFGDLHRLARQALPRRASRQAIG